MHIGDAGIVGRGGETSFVEGRELLKRAGRWLLLGEAGVDGASRGITGALIGLGWLTFMQSVNKVGAVAGTEKQGGGGRTSMAKWRECRLRKGR